jgi:hypothetical protein
MPDAFDQVFSELGIDPSGWQAGPVAQTTGEQAPPGPSMPGASWLDWINQAYGPSASRGSGFADLPQGTSLGDVVSRFNADTGGQARYLAGPSGDRVDFGTGRGVEDVLTSGGQLWQANDPRGNNPVGEPQGRGGTLSGDVISRQVPAGWGGTGGGSPGSMAMPNAPTAATLEAPAPFSYPTSSLGAFQGPAAYQAPSPFQSPSGVPTPQQATYNPMSAPAALTYANLANPEQVAYQAAATPTAFAGSRQADPAALNYTNLATPAGYQAERYQGLSAAEFAADPGRQFREQRALDAQANISAHMGALRTGNALQAQGQLASDLASQEYGAADARTRATNQMNNATSLGAYQTNAQTGLAYNQNANQNALNFGQQNIANTQQANAENYGRASNEAQQGFANQFAVNQANNAGALNAAQANNAANFNVGQANNAGNLAFGNQNFQNQFATNQANNQGQFQTTQANNANALAAQGQQYGQAANTWGMNQQAGQSAQNQNFQQALAGYGANLGAQNQGYQQALGTYGQNAQTGLAYGTQNQQNQLANYQAQVNASLGLGNLNLGYTQAANNYALGQGGLGIQQGNLNLAQQGQQFNQGLQTWQQNYQQNVLDPWNMNYQLASLGNPGAPNGAAYAGLAGENITGAGNANAAGQVGSANAWGSALGNIGNAAQQASYLQWLNQQPRTNASGNTFTTNGGGLQWYE